MVLPSRGLPTVGSHSGCILELPEQLIKIANTQLLDSDLACMQAGLRTADPRVSLPLKTL